MTASSDQPPRARSGVVAYGATQAAFALFLVLASRVLTGTPPNTAGVLDDLSLVAAFAGLQVSVWPKRGATGKRLLAGLPLALLLALFVFGNALFFSFFQTPISVASLQLAGIAIDASSSLPKLLSAPTLVGLLLAPLAGQTLVLVRWAGTRSGSGGRLAPAGALFGTALVLGFGASLLREPVFLFAEQNPAMSLLRDATARTFGTRAGGKRAPLDDLPRLLNRDASRDYAFAGDAERPLLQRPRAGAAPAEPPPRRNVVLILMESMRGLEMQGGFRDVPVTPNLDALEASSVVFPNLYANGMTTVDGEFSILCSVLPVVGEAPVYIRKPDLDIRCLPEILRTAGYSTHWISAYKSTYANKRRFLRGHGVDRVHDRKTMDPGRARHPAVGWGMGDVDMFEQAAEKLGKLPEPFFAEIMTLSNHHPFDHDYDLEFPDALARQPGNQHYRDYLRGMYYTDHAVGTFLEAARKEPWFSQTLFVIVGDHAVRAYPDAPDGGSLGPVLETEAYFRNRLLLYGPGWLGPATHATLGSHIDIAPTLLDVLGIRAENSFLGVSLLADVPHERRYALMNIGHVFNVRVGDRYCYSVGYSCFEGVFPRCPKGVEPTSLGHTCFESEQDLFRNEVLPGERGGSEPARSLDALERLLVLDRAERIMELNRRLIEEDRFR